MSERASCPSCGSSALPVGPLAPGLTFAGRLLTEPLSGGTLYRCPTCRLAFRAPRLAVETLNALYRAGETTHWKYHLPDRRDWQIALDHLSALPPGRVLDVGCFDGAFLTYVPKSWEKFGVEVDAEAQKRAAAHGITLAGTDATEKPTNGPFDVVTAFDLVEHLPDPLALLRTWQSVTTPGGLIIIGTGDADAPTWRLMGSRYWYCAVPEHLSFVSPAWCRWAAERLGLDLIAAERYSHHPRASLRQRLREAGANVLHRVAPSLFRTLSRLRNPDVAGREVPNADDLPATWMSARDHVLAVFRVRS